MTGNPRGNPLIDRVPSPFWHIINLRSNQIVLCSVFIGPCVSISHSVWNHMSTAKSTHSRPNTSHLNILSCALHVLSSVLTLWGSSLVGITDNVYSPWTHPEGNTCPPTRSIVPKSTLKTQTKSCYLKKNKNCPQV